MLQRKSEVRTVGGGSGQRIWMKKWLEEERLELRPSSSSRSVPFSFVLLVFNSFFCHVSVCMEGTPFKGCQCIFSLNLSPTFFVHISLRREYLILTNPHAIAATFRGINL